jgi:hypothetical protein
MARSRKKVRLPRHTVVIALALGLALWSSPAGLASVKRVSFTSTVAPNDYATLTVAVSPRARCTIKVVYDTTVSEARGLGPKSGTKVTWRWKVGSSTHAGRWPVTVDCGKAGKLNLRLRVTA